jgi:hypothetical protein
LFPRWLTLAPQQKSSPGVGGPSWMDDVEERLVVHRADKLPEDKEQPNPKKLAADWDAFLTEINLNEGKRDVLKELSDERKWLLLKAHRKVFVIDQTGPTGLIRDTPEFFAQGLQAEQGIEMVTQLRICLGSKPVSWMDKFLDLDGIMFLLEVLSNVEAKSNKSEDDLLVERECLKCLKIIMNVQQGLDAVLGTTYSMRKLCLCIDSINAGVQSTVLTLLAAVCLCFETDGHKQVLEAMSHFKLVKRENARFETLIRQVILRCRAVFDLVQLELI